MKKEGALSFIKFCIVGATNTAISLIIYYILISINLNYLLSISIGYIVSSVCGYFLSKTWVFKKKDEKIAQSIFKYYILYGSALLLNLLCMFIFVRLLHIPETIAPIITIVITTVYNFFLSKFWVFRKTDSYIDYRLAKKDKFLIILISIFTILVSAVLVNNLFNHPVADDYLNYNNIINEIGTNEYSVAEVIPAIGNLSIKTYQTWQGTYFANILFFINPLLVSLKAYKLTMLFIQLFWLLGCWFFFKSIPASDQESRLRNLKLYLLFIIFSILSMYSLGEGLYWFTGSILYIIPFTFSLIFFGLIIRFLKKPQSKKYYFPIFTLAIILGGTSYVTGLVVGFVLLLYTIVSYIKKTNHRLLFSLLLVVFCIGFAFNVFCPGNFMRISTFEKISIAKATFYSILNAIEMIKHLLFETLFIPFFLIVSPLLISFAHKSNIKFQKPLLLAVLCILCFVATFVPMAYSYGTTYQETRVKNIQLFYLSIMVSVCFINYIGAKKQKLNNISQSPTFIWAGLLSGLIMIPAIGFNNIAGLGLLNDYLYMRNIKYDSCMNILNERLLYNNETPVEVLNCEVYPSSLHYYIMENDSWQTDALEEYYNTEITVIKKGEK